MAGWIPVISSCRIPHHATQQLLPQDASIGLCGSHIPTQQCVLGPDQTGCWKFQRTCQPLCRNPRDYDIPPKMMRSRQVLSQPNEEPEAKIWSENHKVIGELDFPAFVLYFPSLKKKKERKTKLQWQSWQFSRKRLSGNICSLLQV